MNRLAEHLTLQDPLAAQQYASALQQAAAHGNGAAEAGQLAVNGLYTTLQVQSLLVSVKEIVGYVLFVAIVMAVVACFIPFHKTLKVAIVKTGEDMV